MAADFHVHEDGSRLQKLTAQQVEARLAAYNPHGAFEADDSAEEGRDHEGRMHRHRVPAKRLILEVTESALMRDVDDAVRVLRRLHGIGANLAIDDFGTGYSSLAQLKRLPVDELKIDKSFVVRLARGSDDDVIVRSTIELGHNMGLRVIAEGVESPEALALLRSYGCDMAQGYLFSRPLGGDALVEWARAFRLHGERTPLPLAGEGQA